MFNLDHQTQFVCRVDVLTFVYLQVPDHKTIIKIFVVQYIFLSSTHRACALDKFWYHCQRNCGEKIMFQRCCCFEGV